MLPAVLNSHFEDRKSIALGISYAGATIGAVIFPVIIQSLLDYYGFHGAMLIIGGMAIVHLFLHTISMLKSNLI